MEDRLRNDLERAARFLAGRRARGEAAEHRPVPGARRLRPARDGLLDAAEGLGEGRRADRAGLNDADTQPERMKFEPERIAEGFERRLRAAQHAAEGDGDARPDGAEIDDAAAAGKPQP